VLNTINVVSSNPAQAICEKVCQWLATGQWFSPGTPISSTNKTDSHDISEILLKVALNTIIQTKPVMLQLVIYHILIKHLTPYISALVKQLLSYLIDWMHPLSLCYYLIDWMHPLSLCYNDFTTCTMKLSSFQFLWDFVLIRTFLVSFFLLWVFNCHRLSIFHISLSFNQIE
jgi:hypothetical protein